MFFLPTHSPRTNHFWLNIEYTHFHTHTHRGCQRSLRLIFIDVVQFAQNLLVLRLWLVLNMCLCLWIAPVWVIWPKDLWQQWYIFSVFVISSNILFVRLIPPKKVIYTVYEIAIFKWNSPQSALIFFSPRVFDVSRVAWNSIVCATKSA